MVFIPQVPQQTASPEAQDLANRISVLVQDYQRHHPHLTERDVRDALRAVAEPERGGRRPAVLAVVAGLMAALLVLGLFVQQRGGGAEPQWSVPVVAVAVVIGLVAALVRRRS